MEGDLPFLLCFALYLRATSNYKPPPGGEGLYSEGRFIGGFLRYEFGGLIHEGAYFRNCTVFFIGLSGSVFAFFVVSCRL